MNLERDAGAEGGVNAGPSAPVTKLLQQPRSKIMLAAAASGILVLGYLVAPTTDQPLGEPEAAAVPTVIDIPTRRQSLEFVRGVRIVAEQVAPYVVRVRFAEQSLPAVWPAPERPLSQSQGYGLLVEEQMVLTDRSDIPVRSRVRVILPDGQEVGATVETHDGGGITLLRLDSGVSLHAAPLTDRRVASGEVLIAAAGGRTGSSLAAPYFVVQYAGDEYRLTGSPPDTLRGAPLFTTQGEAAALITGGASGPRALDIHAAIRRARQPAQVVRPTQQHRADMVGMTVQALSPTLEPFFKAAAGVLVGDVRPGSSAAAAGLRAGDVIVAAQRAAISDPAALLQLLGAAQPDRPIRLTVLRDGVRRVFLFRLLRRNGTDARSSSDLRTGELFPPDALRAAGVPPNARVLSVDRRPPKADEPLDAPRLLHVEVGGRRFYAAIGPVR